MFVVGLLALATKLQIVQKFHRVPKGGYLTNLCPFRRAVGCDKPHRRVLETIGRQQMKDDRP